MGREEYSDRDRSIRTPADGYRLTKVAAVPDSVKLAGTEQAFESLGDTLTLKDIVSVEGVSESFTQPVDLTETIADLPELKLVEEAVRWLMFQYRWKRQVTHTVHSAFKS